jgi:hypothetical protein
MQGIAVQAAAELVQVAAMCQKAFSNGQCCGILHATYPPNRFPFFKTEKDFFDGLEKYPYVKPQSS